MRPTREKTPAAERSPPIRTDASPTTHRTAKRHSHDRQQHQSPSFASFWAASSESRYNSAPGWTIDENAVREAVYEPAAKIRQGFPNQMATYQGRINDKELRALIAYMKSISNLTTDFDPDETWGDLDPDAAEDAAQNEANEGDVDETDTGETDPGEDTGGVGIQVAPHLIR